MAKKFNHRAFIINTLRRASYRYPARNEALKLARVERGFYKCAMCANVYPKKEISLDHVDPVVALSGFTTWDDYINRMYPNINGEPNALGYQVLCNPCHDAKTLVENKIRKNRRKGIAKKKKKE